MRKLPYDDYSRAEMILRDWLAMDRTVFAGNRTFMGYIRAAITLVIATLVFMAVFHQAPWHVLLYAGFVISIMVLLAGVFQYRFIKQHHRDLHDLEHCAKWDSTES